MPYIDIILTLVLLITTTYTDIKQRKIDNKITFPITLFGFLNTICLYGFPEVLQELIWVIPVFAIVFILFKLHQIGGGDAKLILAVFACMGWQYSLTFIGISFVFCWIYIFYKYLKECGGNLKKTLRIDVPFAPMLLCGFLCILVMNFVM